jgi:putative ATPase
LNVFEIIISAFPENESIEITNKLVQENAQQSLARYDKDGDQHYDIISAFIKAIR